MKVSKRTIDDLLTMIQHSRSDMSYDAGGSFALAAGNIDEKVNVKDVHKVERAIEFIKKIILERS